MTKSLLQGELPHPPLPHFCRVRMAQCVRSLPGFANAEALAMASEHFDHCVVTQGLVSVFAASADEKHKGAIAIGWWLLRNVGVQGAERLRLMQFNNPLHARFCPHASGMIRSIPDDHPATP